MIVDIRTYKFRPGKMNDWLKLYEEFAWPLQQKYLGECVGFFATVEGALHQVVHIWRFQSQADREARRGAMAQDPAWGVFLKKAAELDCFLGQENSIARDAPFFTAK